MPSARFPLLKRGREEQEDEGKTTKKESGRTNAWKALVEDKTESAADSPVRTEKAARLGMEPLLLPLQGSVLFLTGKKRKNFPERGQTLPDRQLGP